MTWRHRQIQFIGHSGITSRVNAASIIVVANTACREQALAAREVVVPQFFPYEETARWCLAADLGQSSDPTAIAILVHRRGIVDAGNSFERRHGLSGPKQTKAERIDVRHLQRMPLHTPYPEIVRHIAELMARPPLADSKPQLVLDLTGVGAPLFDMFVAAGLKPLGIVITGAFVDSVQWVTESRVHVSKQLLISTVDARLHAAELRFSAQLAEAAAMRAELQNFRRQLTAQGRSTFSARTGTHDDLLLAVAIGCWFLSLPPPPRITLGGY